MNSAASNSLRMALVGNPNCGKTALFNRLTGARQKVANYAGVTIERKEGKFHAKSGRLWYVLDLPGAYSLNAVTPDEKITQDVVTGAHTDEAQPDVVVCVVDATNLKRGLRIALELRETGCPMILAVNMMDVAKERNIHIDIDLLQRSLGIPVVETIAIDHHGIDTLLLKLEEIATSLSDAQPYIAHVAITTPEDRQSAVNELLLRCVSMPAENDNLASYKIDRFILHPFFGPIIFTIVMFLVFQAVFTWAQIPMDLIKLAVDQVGVTVQSFLAPGMLQDLLVKGVIGGAGSVLVFLPQIVILFFFILVMEDSGYLPRAAFLLDRVMGKVGLSGRAFIPLLSSFACAIPGIMATRTIQNPRDRLVTIMIAPLMTCSARLPVYALIIAAFIPQKMLFGWLNCFVFSLYCRYRFCNVGRFCVQETLG
jgi:ferrous iron transport protein B